MSPPLTHQPINCSSHLNQPSTFQGTVWPTVETTDLEIWLWLKVIVLTFYVCVFLWGGEGKLGPPGNARDLHLALHSKIALLLWRCLGDHIG